MVRHSAFFQHDSDAHYRIFSEVAGLGVVEYLRYTSGWATSITCIFSFVGW